MSDANEPYPVEPTPPGGQPPAAPQPGEPDAHGDALPSAASLRRFGTVRFRHGDKILCLAYSPDGKTIASGGRNDPVRLWNAETGELIRTLAEHWVWAVAFSPDGEFLATGGANIPSNLVVMGTTLFFTAPGAKLWKLTT